MFINNNSLADIIYFAFQLSVKLYAACVLPNDPNEKFEMTFSISMFQDDDISIYFNPT